MNVQTYLFFNGRTQQALDFYAAAIGASVEMLMRFKDNPEPPDEDCGPVDPEQVMHASFRVGDSVLMASDGPTPEGAGFANFSLSFNADDEAGARRAFDALADGGKVVMPLGRTFWSPCFGMLVDRFGLSWMVGVPHKP